MLTESSPNPSI